MMAGVVLAQNPPGVIVDDRFANANSQLQDPANNSLFVFNGRANNVRTDSVGTLAIDMTPAGGSSEAAWAFFTAAGKPVTLGVGDTLRVAVTFSTTGFKANGQDIRFGLLDSQGTRNTAILAGGMNDATFVNDTGYGLDYYPGGTGSPFVIGRRTVLSNANIFNNFGDFATIAGTGASDRVTIVDGTQYTLTYTIQRLSATDTVISADVNGLAYSATENSPSPATTFDYFAFRVSGTSFANGLNFHRILVAYTPAPPVITSQPQPSKLVVQVGGNVSMSIAASGGALSYQWQRDGIDVSGGTGPTLQLTNVQLGDAGNYRAVISNAGGTVTGDPVTLGVSVNPVPPPPSLLSKVRDLTVLRGATAQLSVNASGAGLFYQWFKNGALLPGATDSTLVFNNAQVADAGAYSVTVSNLSGSVTGNQARVLVVSAMSAVEFSPYNGQDHVCTDTPLRVTFDQPVTLGKSGKIQIYNSSYKVVDTIDLASNPQTRQIGGVAYNYFPVIVDDNSATIYLHRQLPYNDVYFVAIDPGVFADVDGTPHAGLNDADYWSFFSRYVPPQPGTSNLTVSADGGGNFCTVQAAIDFVPGGNTSPFAITVKPGIYNEILYIPSDKAFITIRGADRGKTIVRYANNANLNSGNSRVTVGVDAPDFTLENITLRNTTPRGGSQAEAFRGNNSRILLNRVNLFSFQDTLLMNGQAFVTDSYIEGDVDFMWGNGAVYFQYSELKGVTSGGFYTQIRNGRNQVGNVYADCVLSAPDGVTGMYLSRIDPTAFPYSQVVYLNTTMGAQFAPAGWLLNNATTAPNVQFWEYKSKDSGGTPIDVSARAPFSRQLTDAEAAQWSDPAKALAGWVPYTVNFVSAIPPSATRAGEVSVPATSVRFLLTFSAAPDHNPIDSIGLYPAGATDAPPIATVPVGAANRGILAMDVPNSDSTYELRYIATGSKANKAVSAPFKLTVSGTDLPR